MKPLPAITVTAAVATFNRAKELLECIHSIQRQTVPVEEIIVVDDGSTDNTEVVIHEAKSRSAIPIRYIKKLNGGVSSARNRAIVEAKTDYIAFSDDDDIWADNHIELFYKAIGKSNDKIACFSGLIARDTEPTVPIFPKNEALLEAYELFDEEMDLYLKSKKYLTNPFYTPSFSASILNCNIARNLLLNEKLKSREDIAFFWLLSERGNIFLHKQIHAYARQLEVSLLSVQDTASHQDQNELSVKRSYWEVAMMEYITKGRTKRDCPVLFELLGKSMLGYAYFSLLNGDQLTAKSYLRKSIEHYKSVKQIKLMVRLLLSPRLQ